MDEGDFTKARSILFPRNVLAGHGVLEQIPEVCRDFGLSGTALIVTGSKTKDVAADIVTSRLTESGFEVQTIMAGDATEENLKKVECTAREIGATFLLGVGGGSKIDLAKMAAKDLGLEFISVPTSASHDGIASGRASIKGEGGPLSLDARVPVGVVADTSIIVQAPYRLLAAGCADVISNITAVKDWEYAKRLRGEEFSRSAYSLALYTAETIIDNADLIKPNLEESVWVAIRPIIISGVSMSVAGSSRPTSGSEHMFSHALDMIAPGKALHGEQCGVGAIMMMYLHGGDWTRLREALAKIGAPTSAKELGVTKEQVIEALVTAHKVRSRFTILGHVGLTHEAAERLATITKVI
ncbi:NAD(P)-dependent glycerol-1-phosphate dehydrogenase [Methanomassiliicoccus luminyensis]|uniref:NAD(P)-dependent glycerol-1-phosphate dehydrogenase n=1 Tax=Methanomassiliicoccus luminyensis TaxID=1080712 RepID=UPI000375CC5D|nr:NAD(P)-dependent glycerol-1-phosphate dehydrogenase [Methanomassiliicoccus luminyensis]